LAGSLRAQLPPADGATNSFEPLEKNSGAALVGLDMPTSEQTLCGKTGRRAQSDDWLRAIEGKETSQLVSTARETHPLPSAVQTSSP